MIENTNKAIALNSLVLYFKMGITTICSLFITRFALIALGNTDFGLYSVLGGIIAFIAIFNTIMLSTTNRYISVAIGKGNLSEANTQFNVCLVVHIAIALLSLIIALPLGNWYVFNFINYDGSISDALIVFNISVIGSILSFIGVPYNGLLLARERFFYFCAIDIFVHFVKLIISYLLIDHFENKLVIYAITLSILSFLPSILNWLYCKLYFSNIIRFKFINKFSNYKDILSYSAWISFGAFAQIGKNQGAALLVNAFYNTLMNTALGLANSINGYISLFAQNVTQPMAPQITKSYAAGKMKRAEELLVMSTKYSYLMMFLVASPFLVSPEWLVNLWLGDVPPYVVSFTVLLIIDNLVLSLNSGIANIIFASGKIILYQISISLLNILSVVIAFLVLRQGFPATSLLYAYISVSVMKFFVVQGVLYHTLKFDFNILLKQSYLPSITTTVLFLPILLIKIYVHPLLLIILGLLYLLILILVCGLNQKERTYFFVFLYNKLIRKNGN